jgi:hypothetical protein
MSTAVALRIRDDGTVAGVRLPVDRRRPIDRYIDYFGGPAPAAAAPGALTRIGAERPGAGRASGGAVARMR